MALIFVALKKSAIQTGFYSENVLFTVVLSLEIVKFKNQIECH